MDLLTFNGKERTGVSVGRGWHGSSQRGKAENSDLQSCMHLDEEVS